MGRYFICDSAWESGSLDMRVSSVYGSEDVVKKEEYANSTHI